MPAKGQGNDRHHQQRQNLSSCAVGANKGHQQQEGNHQRRQIQLMAMRQHQRFRRNLAAQFAKGHNRAGEGHRTDKDAEEHFRQVNIHQDLFHTRFVIQVAVKAYQHRGQAHKAVQHGNQLRHFGHFDFLRQANTNRAADNHRQDDPRHVAGIRPENGRQQRDSHPGHPEQVTLLRGFVL